MALAQPPVASAEPLRGSSRRSRPRRWRSHPWDRRNHPVGRPSRPRRWRNRRGVCCVHGSGVLRALREPRRGQERALHQGVLLQPHFSKRHEQVALGLGRRGGGCAIPAALHQTGAVAGRRREAWNASSSSASGLCEGACDRCHAWAWRRWRGETDVGEGAEHASASAPRRHLEVMWLIPLCFVGSIAMEGRRTRSTGRLAQTLSAGAGYGSSPRMA